MVKKNQECFPYVIEKLGTNPEEIFFIDDSLGNVEAAVRYGKIPKKNVYQFPMNGNPSVSESDVSNALSKIRRLLDL
jgi:FMN phosphatase YigB (HAD superfamily)